MRMVQIVLGLVLFVAVAVFAVHQQVRVVQLGYELHRVESEQERLEEETRTLRAEIAEKRHPRHLAETVREYELPIEPPHKTSRREPSR